MKKLLYVLLAGLALSIPSTHAQGQFVFVNRVAGLFDVPVVIAFSDIGAGTLGDVRAQLWTADGNSMLAESTFRGSSGVQAKYFFPVDVTVEGNTGQPMLVELRFLLNEILLHGPGDNVFSITPALPPNPPANIGGPGVADGLTGPLIILPEPSTIALAAFGLGAFLLRRRKPECISGV